MFENFHIIIAIFGGAILGSFTTMLVWRLHHDEPGIVAGRSKCPKCNKTLGALQLVPVLSWLFQFGKCHNCKSKIPVFYPLVELIFIACGVIFVQKFYPTSPLILALGLLLVFFALILWVYDTKFFEVDRRISWPAIAIALAWAIANGFWQSALIGGAIGFSLFAVQYFYSKGKWVGAGDMELGLFMGLALGWEHTIAALFLAYIIGSLIAIPLLFWGKKNMKSQLPMGAFLIPAMLIILHSGDRIVEWYIGLLV